MSVCVCMCVCARAHLRLLLMAVSMTAIFSRFSLPLMLLGSTMVFTATVVPRHTPAQPGSTARHVYARCTTHRSPSRAATGHST